MRGRTALAGEVGLTGEVRGIVGAEARAREAGRLGFSRIVLPRRTDTLEGVHEGIEIVRVGSVNELLEVIFHG